MRRKSGKRVDQTYSCLSHILYNLKRSPQLQATVSKRCRKETYVVIRRSSGGGGGRRRVGEGHLSVEDKIPVGPAVSLPVNCTCQIRPDPHEKKLKTFNFHFLTNESLKKEETIWNYEWRRRRNLRGRRRKRGGARRFLTTSRGSAICPGSEQWHRHRVRSFQTT